MLVSASSVSIGVPASQIPTIGRHGPHGQFDFHAAKTNLAFSITDWSRAIFQLCVKTHSARELTPPKTHSSSFREDTKHSLSVRGFSLLQRG